MTHDSGVGMGGYTQGQGTMSVFIFIATFIVILVGLDYQLGDGLSFYSWGLLAALILFFLAPDFYLRSAHQNARYAVTDSQVFFRLLHWGKMKTFVIDWEDVHKISWEEYKGGEGTIYFMCHEQSDFDTYDFRNWNRRMHVTFELVPDVKKVYEEFELLRKSKYVKKEIVAIKKETPSEIERFKKRVAYVQSFVFGYLLLYAFVGISNGNLLVNYAKALFFFFALAVILISQLFLFIDKKKVDKFYLVRVLIWTGLSLCMFLFMLMI